VQAQVRRGTEPAAGRDLIHGQVGGLEQPPGFEQPLGGEPAQRGGAGFRDEAAGERSRRPAGVSSEVGDAQRLGESLQRPRTCRPEAATAGWDGPLQELRLTALAVRRHDHAPGNAGGGLRTAVTADQMQAQIDSGCDTCAGGHRSVVEVENIWIDIDFWVTSRELRGIAPMSRRAPPVEQPGGGQGERPGADRDHSCTSNGGRTQRFEHRWGGLVVRSVAGHDHGVGRSKRVEPERGVHGKAGRRGHDSRHLGAHREGVVVRLIAMAKDLRRDRQVKYDHVRQGQRDNAMHGQHPNVHRHSCPWTARPQQRRLTDMALDPSLRPEPRQIGILLFDGVEELDAVGPWEVLASWTREHPTDGYAVCCLSRNGGPVTAAKGLVLGAHRALIGAPALEVLVHPGGAGTRPLLRDPAHLAWVREQRATVPLMTSVCTGALVYAAAGLLHGRPATTHWRSLDELRALDPSVQVREDDRWVDDGDVVTSAGVSAGIDMSLYLVARLAGPDRARQVRRAIQYDPQPPV